MASKIPPPDGKITKESAAAAQAAKAFEKRTAEKGTGTKKVFDPLRDPKSYTADELSEMLKSGDVTNTFTQEGLTKFVLGEITWSELTGLTMQDAYAFAEVAYNLFEQGKYDNAQTIVEGLVISNPYDGYFHSLLGSIYGRKGMHEEALEEYSIAIELDDKNLAAYVNRAEVLLQHGEIIKALEDLKVAVDLDPRGEKPFGIRARALAQATASILEEAMREKGMDPAALQKKGAAKPASKPAAKPASKPAAKPAGKKK
jgi:tetratricopeptide (TPR) repeat protein